MTLELTVTPEERSLPPAQRRAPQPQNHLVNDNFFGEFADVLDIINPLQHLPVISTLYREMTDDVISPGARLFGGTLFGGPLGFASSLVNVMVEDGLGKDVGGTLFAQVQEETPVELALRSYEQTNQLL